MPRSTIGGGTLRFRFSSNFVNRVRVSKNGTALGSFVDEPAYVRCGSSGPTVLERFEADVLHRASATHVAVAGRLNDLALVCARRRSSNRLKFWRADQERLACGRSRGRSRPSAMPNMRPSCASHDPLPAAGFGPARRRSMISSTRRRFWPTQPTIAGLPRPSIVQTANPPKRRGTTPSRARSRAYARRLEAGSLVAHRADLRRRPE